MEQTHSHADVVRALEENLWALWSRFGRGEGCALHEEDEALWFDTPIAHLPYNAVLRFTAEEDVDQKLDRIFNHYRRRGVPFMWMVHPTSRPLDLDERLLARGFREVEVCPGMWMSLEDLPAATSPPAGIEFREATGADERAVLELVAWRWDVPPAVRPKLAAVTREFHVGAPGSAVRCLMAWKDHTPLSKVILNYAAGVAGLYGVATRPEARGMGLARALTLRAFAQARRDGYRIGVLHSSPMAFGLYEKIGFAPLVSFRIFAPPVGFQL